MHKAESRSDAVNCRVNVGGGKDEGVVGFHTILQNPQKIVEHDEGKVLIGPEGGIRRESLDEYAGFDEDDGRWGHLRGMAGGGRVNG